MNYPFPLDMTLLACFSCWKLIFYVMSSSIFIKTTAMHLFQRIQAWVSQYSRHSLS